MSLLLLLLLLWFLAPGCLAEPEGAGAGWLSIPTACLAPPRPKEGHTGSQYKCAGSLAKRACK